MTREEFERLFHSRTLAYHPEYRHDDRPVVVVFGEAADSAPGHALLVSLVNQLARAHRRLVLVGDLDRPLRGADHFGLESLRDASAGLAQAINPFIDVTVQSETFADEALVSFGIAAEGCDLRLGADGWVAKIGPDAAITERPTSVLGAGLVSCLAAATAFHRVLGASESPHGAYSLWDYGRQSDLQGPEVSGPLDVGRVLLVGAGAVGCALVWWLGFFGAAGDWTIADGDDVDVTNLNRQLLFLAADAGYPDQTPRNKADAVAARLGDGTLASPSWYGQDDAVVRARYDLVLPLANERGARQLLQARAQPVFLHATTSPSWQAQLHRHVAGRDDCINCRLPEQASAFMCATGEVGREKPADASLPFLCATAGLLLLAEIIRLQQGRILEHEANYHAIDLRTPTPFTQSVASLCTEGCHSWMAEDARILRTEGMRFACLDGALSGTRAHGPQSDSGQEAAGVKC